jgi:hypothetical protein
MVILDVQEYITSEFRGRSSVCSRNSPAGPAAPIGPALPALTVLYVFKQEGAKLTGMIDVSGGNDETSNLHGKVDGNEISFTVPFSDGTYETKSVCD